MERGRAEGGRQPEAGRAAGGRRALLSGLSASERRNHIHMAGPPAPGPPPRSPPAPPFLSFFLSVFFPPLWGNWEPWLHSTPSGGGAGEGSGSRSAGGDQAVIFSSAAVGNRGVGAGQGARFELRGACNYGMPSRLLQRH